jgi:hypothetical protein
MCQALCQVTTTIAPPPFPLQIPHLTTEDPEASRKRTTHYSPLGWDMAEPSPNLGRHSWPWDSQLTSACGPWGPQSPVLKHRLSWHTPPRHPLLGPDPRDVLACRHKSQGGDGWGTTPTREDCLINDDARK